MSVDRALNRSFEGFSLTGYVPRARGEKSGVSVATAFDLGQRDERDLRGLPAALQAKLRPYLGLKGSAAQAKLRAVPLRITVAEADLLDTRAYHETLRNLRAQVPGFDRMPDAIQTVAYSLAYQYGDLRKECPRFYAFLCSHDWLSLYRELRNFGDKYRTRRWAEAAYLLQRLPELRDRPAVEDPDDQC